MEIRKEDLEDLARGTTLLGSGGGGETTSDCLFAEALLGDSSIPLKQLSQLREEELVLCVASIGAPLVSSEKLSSGEEWVQVVHLVEQHLNKPIDNLVCGEIGGSNGFSGLIAAQATGKHLIDADSLGRAFPHLNISSCSLFGVLPSPASIVDVMGNAATFHTSSPTVLEEYARAIVTAMGSSAAAGFYPMTGSVAKRTLIEGSMSFAIHIGRLLRNAPNISIFLEHLSQIRPCHHLGGGVITDIRQEIDNGFLHGSIVIEGNAIFTIDFQNEYLAVFCENRPISTTPDIIALVTSDTVTPLGSDQVRHGLQVEIIIVAAPTIWKTPAGLQLTGPSAFGYPFSERLL